MIQVCSYCGSQAIEQLGVGAFAATWECKACGGLWDFDDGDLKEQADSLSAFHFFLQIELLNAFDQPTDYPAWLRSEERRFVHFWVVPLRLSQAMPHSPEKQARQTP